jgi:hypothetical protein
MRISILRKFSGFKMNQQNSGSSPNQGGGNNKRPNNNNRRPQQNNNRPQGGNNQGPNGPQKNAPQGAQNPGQGGNNPNRRRHHNNRNRNQGNRPPGGSPQGGGQQLPQQQGGFNLDRVYEKYLNLLDQHLIARRKYHDLFYRADPAQKSKLERNFYSTLNDIREFENRLAPDVRDLFEKRNNGLAPDRTYTSNREMSVLGDEVASDMEIEDPHYLHSQKTADFEEDKEESTGTLDDYLKYKNLL